MENKKLEVIQEETNEIISLSNNLSIDDAETLVDGIDILTRIKSFGERSKEVKKDLLEPFELALKNAKAKFKPAEKACKDGEVIIKGKIIEYISEKATYSCEGNAGKISLRKLSKVVIVDLDSIPSKYFTQVPNEKLIKEDLLNGIKVDGAEIKISESLALLKK